MLQPELILFDLGGVLVETTMFPEVSAFCSSPITEEEQRNRYEASACFDAFERGAIDAAEFLRRFREEWQLLGDDQLILDTFTSWSRRLFPGVEELLDQLRLRYRLAVLSNSNELHWRRNAEVLGVPELFERIYSSHELGLRKPDRDIYTRVLTDLGLQPQEVVFVDDREANVAVARELGMTAFRVRRPEGVRQALREAGLL